MITVTDPVLAARLHRVRRPGPITGPEDPRHGSDTGYVAGCRADCCRRAHARRRKLDRLYPGATALVDATGTHRRIRALARLGWSFAEQSRHLGKHRDYVSKVLDKSRLQVETRALFKALYEELSMTWCDTPAAGRTAAAARAAGWPPPLAWDEDIDDPAAVPHTRTTPADVDEVAVERILSGEWRLPCTKAEKAETARRWHATGRSLTELGRLTGWKVERYYQAREVAA